MPGCIVATPSLSDNTDPAPEIDPSEDTAIRRELITSLFAKGRLTAGVSLAGFIATAVMLYGHIPGRQLAVWFGAGLLVVALRFALSEYGDKVFKRMRDRLMATLCSVALMGCVWGTIALFWRSDLHVTAQLVIMMFPVAVSLLSVAAYANWLPVFMAMVLPAQFPLLALTLISTDSSMNLLALPAFVLLAGQVVLVRRLHAQLRENIELKFGNEALVRDLSERHDELLLAHDAANAASVAKSEFLSRMSHELRTPLNGVLGMTNALSESKLDARQRARLDVLATAGNELFALVSELLDATLLHTQSMQLEPDAIRISDLVADIEVAVQPSASVKGLTLNVVVDSGVPEVILADPDRLQQVVFALLDNAVKFTDHGRVDLRLAANRGSHPRLHLIVEDTGVGISAEDQAQVFDLFTQADGSNARRYGGMGVGLAVTSQLVQLMGGRLDLWSTPGVGTRMTVELPLTEASVDDVKEALPVKQADVCSTEPLDNSMAIADVEADADDQRIDVLVVEDNKVNRLVLESLLDDAVMDVRFAENGVQAVEQVESSVPDLVLMDCQMPVMDGYDATREIRKRGVSVPIIAVTANAMAGDRERCLSAGMNDYVSKPLDPGALDAALSRWLGEDFADPQAA